MSKKLSIITIVCFILSIVAGLTIPNVCSSISFLGTIYVNLLKIMIVPVLFTSIATTLAEGTTNSSKITINSIFIFIVMFVVSFLICSGVWSLAKPGVGYIFTATEWTGETVKTTFGEFCVNLFPTNIITAMSNNTILPVIIFAFVFGIAVNKVDSLRQLTNVLHTLTETFHEMLKYVMYLTPIGVFALMSNTVATYGGEVLKVALKYVLAAWVGCAIIWIIVMVLPAVFILKSDYKKYFKSIFKLWMITLSTCSSAATLPNTIKVCNEELNIPENITNITVPLGCTIHMCGGAVSFSLLAMFNMQMYGIPVTMETFVTMVAAALLINMGAPGIPGGGIVIGASYLALLGVPLDFIGFYAGIYRLLDMAYTTMNVTGDVTANIIVNRLINEKS